MRRLRAAIVAASCAGSIMLSCGSATVVQCRVEAVRFLPDDPMQVTVFDTFDLVQRLKACDGQPAAADAGKP